MIALIFASSEYMSNNVVRKTDEPESESGPLAVVSGDGQADLFNGQKQPAPYLHDPKVVHDASPAYYLKNEGLTALILHLQDAVSDCGPMQVIIAEHGRGKSALIRQLVTEAGEQWSLCHIHADYHLGVDHIINGLGQIFLPDECVDFESLVSGLVSSVAQSPVVIVDDAQNISSYALETLANIKRAVVERGGEIAIILCASPELRRNLSSHGMAKFKDKWFEVHALPRFNEEDTSAYLSTRFESNGTTQFTPAQLQTIHRRACGIPACINYHAELALGRVVSDERLRLDHQQMLKRQKKMPYFIVGTAVVLLIAVVTILSMTNPEPDGFIDEARFAEVATPVSTPVATAPPATPTRVPPVVEKKAVARPEVKQPVAVKVKPVAKPAPDASPKSLPIKVEPKLVSQEKLVTVNTATKPVVAKPVPELKTVAVQKAEIKKTVAPMAASSDETIPGAKWLKAQPVDYFTIQLAGSPDEKNIIRYITRSSLDGELAYVLIARKNRSSWYVVLHGSFESRAEANRVVEFFPPELKKNKPWIRQFSKLRNALDEN